MAAEQEVRADWLASQFNDASARGIAVAITALVRNGDLGPGSRLPTVRQLATELGVSPGTVSGAWQVLRRRRIIATRRRGGTAVIGLPTAPHPARFEQVGNFGTRSKVDLTFATPDPGLLPSLQAALHAGLSNQALNTYEREAITPRLRDSLEHRWPFPSADWLAVNGGYEGVLLLCLTNFGPGEAVAVEDPTAPRLLDIVSVVGATPLRVPCDGAGPLPDALDSAIAAGAVAFLYQPRAQSPCGHRVTKARSEALARILHNTSVLVMEDDGLGEVASPEIHSLGHHIPDRTVLVRSYAKSHGPDLRLGVMAGAGEPIERARTYRNFGPRWTSRLLQDALAYLLEDPDAQSQVRAARETYAERRSRCAQALLDRGVNVKNRDGFSLWVPVANEGHALVTLGAHGISASPGSQFYVGGGDPHLRLATSRLAEGYDYVADTVALSARSPI